jgi:ParB-like chromosome segregation protein Spo0J
MRAKTIAMQIIWRKADQLSPYVSNPRTHDEVQLEQIGASLLEFGWTNPILIDAKDGIVAGHGRLAAAKRLWASGKTIPNVKRGMAPCLNLGKLSPKQRRAYVIADNKLALNSGWNDELLATELAAVDPSLLAVTGFSDADIVAMADVGKLAFDQEPPATVAENAKKLEALHAMRKKGGEAVIAKSDTEKYLVVVFASRQARERAAASLGLPTDERYIDGAAVELRLRFSPKAAAIKATRKTKAAAPNRSGAHG